MIVELRLAKGEQRAWWYISGMQKRGGVLPVGGGKMVPLNLSYTIHSESPLEKFWLLNCKYLRPLTSGGGDIEPFEPLETLELLEPDLRCCTYSRDKQTLKSYLYISVHNLHLECTAKHSSHILNSCPTSRNSGLLVASLLAQCYVCTSKVNALLCSYVWC